MAEGRSKKDQIVLTNTYKLGNLELIWTAHALNPQLSINFLIKNGARPLLLPSAKDRQLVLANSYKAYFWRD